MIGWYQAACSYSPATGPGQDHVIRTGRVPAARRYGHVSVGYLQEGVEHEALSVAVDQVGQIVVYVDSDRLRTEVYLVVYNRRGECPLRRCISS